MEGANKAVPDVRDPPPLTPRDSRHRTFIGLSRAHTGFRRKIVKKSPKIKYRTHLGDHLRGPRRITTKFVANFHLICHAQFMVFKFEFVCHNFAWTTIIITLKKTVYGPL